MPNISGFEREDRTIDIVVDYSADSSGGATDASVGDVVESVTTVAKRSLGDAVDVLRRVAAVFTEELTKTELRPAEVELAFGIEAGGEVGCFVVSKLSGKSNFSVKLVWKFDKNG